MLQQEYSEELKKVKERWKTWLAYFDTYTIEDRPQFNDDYCIAVADDFIGENAEKRNIQELLKDIPDETILIALKREKAKKE